MSQDLDMAEIAQLFIEESVEGLDIMESGLLNLDLGDADPETMNAIFRAAHSIKGGGATFGFTEISEFAHQVETLLDEMRQGDRPVTREGVDLLLLSVDCIRDMINDLADGEVNTVRAEELEVMLEKMLNTDPSSAPEEDSVVIQTEVETPETGKDESEKGDRWEIGFKPEKDLLKSCNDPIRIFKELETLGSLKVTVIGADKLEFDQSPADELHLSWKLELEGETDRDSILEVFAWVEDQCELTINCLNPTVSEKKTEVSSSEEIAEETQAPTSEKVENNKAEKKEKPSRKPAANAKQASNTNKESSSIRVNIDKVDALINLVGELVITQSMLSRFGGDEFDFAQVPLLREGLSQLSRNTLELQESVMAIRMMPISFAFSRFPRLVRDQSHALGKKVELKLTGEGTELDKTVLEKIGDPLVHLVRNSLDHGLETPEKRVAAGKPEVGTLELKAFHSGGSIVIEVKDDGGGINKQKVIAKARENGLIGPDEEISDDRANNLIFEAGFSTADEVSDLSGRGVGMDVVRRNISDLGGHVVVKSEEGVGSTITITLPLTLAILEGQLLRVGHEDYVIPLVSIVETIQTSSERISNVAGESELFELRDEYLPVIRLHELFGIKTECNDINDGLLVIAEANHQRIGIFVDELLEQQQVVIKSLEANYRRTQGISGATILGDGTVALILDVPGLLKLFKSRNSRGLNKQVAVA